LYIDLNILSVLSMLELLCFSYLQFKDIFLSCLLWQNCFFYPITEKPDFVFNDFF